MPMLKCWMVVKGVPKKYGQTQHQSGPYQGQRIIDSVRATKITVAKPTLDVDEIAFQVEFDVDESWFLDGTAKITASIPAAPQAATLVPATVDMPIKGRAKSAAASVVHP